METFVIVAHVVAALSIIGLILLQQGKGAEMGASFGSGASQTLFGSGGSGNFFARMTTFIAVVFFATSFGLAVIAKDKTTVDEAGVPSVPDQEQQEAPAVQEPDSDVPAVDAPEAGGDVPAVPENGEAPPQQQQAPAQPQQQETPSNGQQNQ